MGFRINCPSLSQSLRFLCAFCPQNPFSAGTVNILASSLRNREKQEPWNFVCTFQPVEFLDKSGLRTRNVLLMRWLRWTGDFRLPSRWKWDLTSFYVAYFCSFIFTDISRKPIFPIWNGEAVQEVLDSFTFDDGTGRLFWSVGNNLPISYA